MPDPKKKDRENASARPGRIRSAYLLCTIGASVAIFLASRLFPARPATELPTVGQMLVSFAVAAAATGVLFGVRLESVVLRLARYVAWGLALALFIVMSFVMSVSESFGTGVAAALGLLENQPEHVAVLTVARTAGAMAVMCIGSIAAFLFSSMLEMKKYHTFLCIRLMRVRVINYLVTLAVAGSVALLIVVLSVLWGFDRDLRERIRGTLAPVSLEAIGNDRVQDYDTLSDWIKKEFPNEVTECAPFVQCFVFLHSPLYTTQALVRGVDIDRESRTGDLAKYLRDKKRPDFLLDGAEPETPGLLIGHELANNVKLRDQDNRLLKGKQVMLRSPLSPDFIHQPTFTVVGEFKTGYLDYDSRFVYIPIASAQKLAGYGPTEASGISIALTDYRYADRVKAGLEKRLKGIYVVKTWAEQRPTMLAAMHLERVVQAIVLGSQILLAGLFVCAVMLMAVKEKTRDIGIVKAVGGTVSGIMEIFLINGFVIGLVGAAIGGTGGLLFVKYVNQIAGAAEKTLGIRIFPTDIYYLDSIPTYVDPVGVGMILCVAIAVALLAAMVPSLIAARLNPVEALRYE